MDRKRLFSCPRFITIFLLHPETKYEPVISGVCRPPTLLCSAPCSTLLCSAPILSCLVPFCEEEIKAGETEQERKRKRQTETEINLQVIWYFLPLHRV